MDRRGPRQYADDLERGTLSLPEEKMPDTDREARMDEIRKRVEAHERGVKGAAHDDEASDLRFLLSEIDRLKAKLEGEDG